MEPRLSRRDMLKLGLIGTGYVILGPNGEVSRADDVNLPPSPPTTPFKDPLPVPPSPDEVSPFSDIPDDYRTPINYIGSDTKYFEIIAEQRFNKFHSDLNPTPIWGYRPSQVVENGVLVDGKGKWPFVMGPTFKESRGANTLERGSGLLVRHVNDLPDDPGFGTTRLSVHLHGGHHQARADGFPENITFPGFPNPVVIEKPGKHQDYLYPTLDPGFLDNKFRSQYFEIMTTERPATMWYHDHIIDFTGPNAYRGLAGFFLVFDVASGPGMTPGGNPTGEPFQDLGDEKDETGLQLPSGVGVFDIPLVIQDKRFKATGDTTSLVFNSFDHDGFLGDTFVVNGAIQPFLSVKRRKYRLRFLNGSNARIYQLFLTGESGQTFPMTQIATEGGLLRAPWRGPDGTGIKSFMLAMAERVEVVVDFADPMFDTIAASSRPFVYIENRLQQTNGRKPDGLVSTGVKILQFRLEEKVPDRSRVGKDPNDPGNPFAPNPLLRPFDVISGAEIQQATGKSFKFDRSHGGWTINGELAGKLETAVATPQLESGVIWHLENSSGGWWHPIHIHSEFFRVLLRNGKTPPFIEQDGISKKDTILLRGGENVDVFLKFRDHLGPFVFHCHNMEHEDMAMMARFDVIE
jgi:FtsP/CotA-like multicopper oxidase with cupredoxin domain